MKDQRPPHLSSPGWIVALLAAVLFINYVDRGALPTASPLIQADLHLGNEQLGRLFSAFFWIYAFIQIPVGWLAERYGAHRILAAGLALWATATMLMGLTSTFATLLMMRMLLGLGESAGFPAVSKILAAVVPLGQLGRANGVVAFAYLFGPAFGIWAGGWLMDQWGWRGAFLVFGVGSLLWLLPWSRVRLPALATSTGPGDGDTPSWGSVLRQRALWGTVLGLFSSNYMLYFMLSWLPNYLVRERGFSMHQMEHLGTAGYTLNAVGALLTGWMIDRYIARRGSPTVCYKLVMFVAHAGAVACMLVMAVGTRPLAVAAMFIFQFLLGASSPGIYAMSQIMAGPRATGRWVGIQNSFGNVAGMISPWLTGVIVDQTGHFTLALAFAAVMSALGIVGWVVMVPTLVQINWRTPRAADTRAAVHLRPQ